MRHQDPNKPLILHTDWSNIGIGAVLGQIDDQGNEYMIACISRSLNVHKRNYGSPQGEMLAAVWAIKTFHTYLHREKFTLVTDHQPLTYIMTKNDLVAMLARWAITLQQYTFEVVHRPGINHQNAAYPGSQERAPQTLLVHALMMRPLWSVACLAHNLQHCTPLSITHPCSTYTTHQQYLIL